MAKSLWNFFYFSRNLLVNRIHLKDLWLHNTKRTMTSLLGRDVCHPSQLSKGELQNILWTAFDMKSLQSRVDLLKGRHVTILVTHPSVVNRIAFDRAALALGANLTCLIYDELCRSNGTPLISGRALGSLTDVIIASGLDQTAIEELADGATVPVVSCSSNLFCIVDVLSQFMTMMEHLGPLARRCLAWVGPTAPSPFTYLYLAPKFNLNFRVFLIQDCNNNASTVSNQHRDRECWEKGMSENRSQADYHECLSAQEAVYRSDVIAVGTYNTPGHTVNHQMLEEAALEWYLIHSLSRTTIEVSDDVIHSKNNLTWPSISNSRFIAMALLLQVLRKYECVGPKPDFDLEE